MKYFNLILITFLLVSCSSGNEKMLQEATELHEQSLKIEKEISIKFEELEQLKNNINIQGRALTDAEIKFTQEVDLLGSSLHQLKENLAKSPKSDPTKISAKESLAIQKELNDSIMAIQAMLKAIKTPSGN